MKIFVITFEILTLIQMDFCLVHQQITYIHGKLYILYIIYYIIIYIILYLLYFKFSFGIIMIYFQEMAPKIQKYHYKCQIWWYNGSKQTNIGPIASSSSVFHQFTLSG